MENQISQYSTAALAYLGDSVLEVKVRERLVKDGLSSSARLNSRALEFVTAPRQAEAMKNILPHLTEEEEAVFKRGRNMGHSNTPKAATMAQYRAATGMETLFGYLHLKGDGERIDALFALAYPAEENKDQQ